MTSEKMDDDLLINKKMEDDLKQKAMEDDLKKRKMTSKKRKTTNLNWLNIIVNCPRWSQMRGEPRLSRSFQSWSQFSQKFSVRGLMISAGNEWELEEGVDIRKQEDTKDQQSRSE